MDAAFKPPSFKELTNFFIAVGADTISHTQNGYLAHAIGVHNDLKSWGCDEVLCRAGMFHSIYGTEIFQGFVLPLDRRREVQQLIGPLAERFAYLNCAMDRSSFDAAVQRADQSYRFRDRFTDEEVELSGEDFDNLCIIHLCDWLEQAPRSRMKDYRMSAYRAIAERLGGVALQTYLRTFRAE